MTLLWSSRSPFVRKVMVTAHETGVSGALQARRVVVAANKPNPEVMAINPLNKIPTLLLADGSQLYDSRVICEFFDSLHTGPRLFPSEPSRRWRALRLQALGDGLMEVGILREDCWAYVLHRREGAGRLAFTRLFPVPGYQRRLAEASQR